jgi:prevent-host-death family protein
MMRTKTCGAEEARANLPALLERAHQGTSVLITKRGRPYAALVPIERLAATARVLPIGALEGSGKGLWGRSARATIRRMRNEWT